MNNIAQFLNEDSLIAFAEDTTPFNKNKSIQQLEVDTYDNLKSLFQYFPDKNTFKKHW